MMGLALKQMKINSDGKQNLNDGTLIKALKYTIYGLYNISHFREIRFILTFVSIEWDVLLWRGIL